MTARVSSFLCDGHRAVPITDAVLRIAHEFPASAAEIPRHERARFFTDDQRAAWTLRFDPPQAMEVTL